MSFSNQNTEIVIDGAGLSSFGINFHYIEGFDVVIKAQLWDYTDPDVPTQLPFVLGVDWSIDESSYPNTLVLTAAPVPVGYKLVIYREHAAIQGSSFAEGAFPAQSIEDTYDINMMVSQENKAKLDRALLNERGGPTVTIAQILQAIADIATNAAGIAANVIAIAANALNIGTNTTNISTNTTNIGTNATNIATNVTDIATNVTDIAANTVAIASVSPFTVVNITAVAAPYNASNKEIVIIDTGAAVEVALPAPTIGYQITVKVNNDIANKKITNAAGIDGFGTDYILSSMYESVSLVSDGAKWYII